MLLSSLSDYEFVCLVAHYNDLSDGEKNKVSSDVVSRGYSEAALAEAQKQKTKKFNPVVSCGLKFSKPFDHLRFETIGYVLTLFENYTKGALPFPGNVSEQPAQIMEIFSVLGQLMREREQKAIGEIKSNGRNKHQNKSRAGR